MAYGTKIKYQGKILNQRQVKQYILKNRGWTNEQYKKYYDILKNQTRSYEAYSKLRGQPVEKINVANLIFKETYSKKRAGASYKPSRELKAIRRFTSISSGKVLTKSLKSERYLTKRDINERNEILKTFNKFIHSNEGAQSLIVALKDASPQKLKQALSDYANKIHEQIDAYDDLEPIEQASTERTGSDDTLSDEEYNAIISKYL